VNSDLNLPSVHLSIVQPVGYMHSLAFLDPARYLRHQLQRFGVNVTLAKNRLREDAINLVFGAHLGFDPALRERNACLFVNLEQLSSGGAKVSDEYLALLRNSGVVDYDRANIGSYGADPADVPLIPFHHAPYLEIAASATVPLEDRPIDLLFFGSLNDRRTRMIERIEACGLTVSLFDHPLYADERDHYIRQAKSVLNCHFYESATFEQVRAFHCVSMGTPVISERSPKAAPDPAFEQAITWFDDRSLEAFFTRIFGTPEYFQRVRRQMEQWKRHDPVDAYAELMKFAAGYLKGHAKGKHRDKWRPTRINLGSGKDYKPGWLNLDVIDRAEPDLVLDLGKPQAFPVRAVTHFGGDLLLTAGSVDLVYANNVLEHVPDLPRLMSNVLTLLKEGGDIEIEVPYEKAPTAWQDPTHIRAMNENSWIYYTEWFWYLGWFEHRFELVDATWLDEQLRLCSKDVAHFMRVKLRKTVTSDRERTIARTFQQGFACPPDDAAAQTLLPIAEEITPAANPGDGLGQLHTQRRQDYVFTNNWFDYQKPIVDGILEELGRAKPIRILEIGAHEGRSTVHYIDHYLNHPDSTILSIDPFEAGDTTTPVTSSTQSTFEHNVRNSRHPTKATLMAERSQKALCGLIAEGLKFDFISVDGSHLAKDVLSDAVLAFELLEEHGVVLFDDYLGGAPDRDTNVNWPKLGIDAFLRSYAGQYAIIHDGYHLAVRKQVSTRPERVRRIFDCFPFNNEIELLRLRLLELKEVVDIFVLVESTHTFSGHPKPLHFSEHASEFSDFNIVHIIIDDEPDANPWINEATQRNAPRRYLLDHMDADDIAVLSDIDEIPSSDTIGKLKKHIGPEPVYLEMDLYYYNLNWLKKRKWCRACAGTRGVIEQQSIEDLRNQRGGSGLVVRDGGWHLSYFLPPAKIAEKIQAFSHQEFNRREFIDLDNILAAIESGRDLFDRGGDEELVPWHGQLLPKNKHVLPECFQVQSLDAHDTVSAKAKDAPSLIRSIVRTGGHFPTEEAANKLVRVKQHVSTAE